MGFLDGFIKRVVNVLDKAVKAGELKVSDFVLLKQILNKHKQTVKVVSRATLAALLMSSKRDDGKIDIKRFKKDAILLEMIVDTATKNIIQNKPAFSEGMRKKLISIFNNMGLDGERAASKFISNYDMLTGLELKENFEKINVLKQGNEVKKVVVTTKKNEKKNVKHLKDKQLKKKIA